MFQSNKKTLNLKNHIREIQKELPQTRFGVTIGRVLTAGPLGFLLACGALYQADNHSAQLENVQEVKSDQKKIKISKANSRHVTLKEEIAFNIALELMQRDIN